MNALYDPWIPVRSPGGASTEVGLRDAVLDAHNIEGLADPRPLGPPTQLRLLIALIQRIFAPEDVEDWRKLWQAGRFDPDSVTKYLSRWEKRFQLLDGDTPFLQVGGDFSIGNVTTIDKLAHDVDPATFNRLFSHSDGPAVPVSQSEALRRLVMAQACAIGGGISGNPTWNGASFVRPNFSHAPLATSAIVVLEGRTLFETILLNLVPVLVEGDLPVWERDLAPVYFEQSTASGPLDRYTNLSRMVRLIADADSGQIAGCYYTQGRTLTEAGADLMVSYRRDDKLGLLPLRISDNRASWRDLHAILTFSHAEGGSDLRAGVLRFVGGLVDAGHLSGYGHIRLRLFGVAADKARVILWRSDRVSFPTAFLAREDLVGVLSARMADAAKMASDIGGRTRSMCWHYLSPVHGQMQPDSATVAKIADQLDARQMYWAALEEQYPKLLEDIGALPDTEPETLAALTTDWTVRCAEAARDALEAAQARLGETPRAWRALAAVSTNFQPKESAHGS